MVLNDNDDDDNVTMMKTMLIIIIIIYCYLHTIIMQSIVVYENQAHVIFELFQTRGVTSLTKAVWAVL